MTESGARTITILIVEDDVAVADLLQQVLSDEPGWTAMVAPDAVAAHSIVQQVQIGVLLLDLHLPGISGLELLELLRQDAAWTEPPIIIVSAVADQPEIQAGLRQTGITKIVRKPFDVDQVIALIQQALT